MTDQRHRLGALPAGADPGQALLHVLRDRARPTRRTTRRRSTSRSTRASSTRAGTSCARRPWRGRSSAGVVPAGTKLTAAPGRDPGLGLAHRRPEAALRAADGGLRRVRRAHRPRGRPAGRRDRGDGRARQHALLLHRGRQRRERRGRAGRQLQRDPGPERHRQRRLLAAARTSTSGAGRRPSRTTPVGWAHAGNTPFQWTKQVASHFGGTRNAMVVHWPARIKDATGRCARSSTT